MKLVQVRECDGVCCKESPRFPNKDKTNCIYRDRWGCKIQRGLAEAPKGKWHGGLGYTNAQVVEETCVKWPHNSEPKLGKTGGCCWQWVDND